MTESYAPEPDDDLSQEEQARLLVEPTFDHEIGDEDELLRYEFGPPNDTWEPPSVGDMR